MRIACSNCNAVYELPPERVRPGRGVKCARCGTVWVPVALVEARPEIEPAPEPAVTPMPLLIPLPPEIGPPGIEPAQDVAPPAEPKPAAALATSTARRRVPALVGWTLTLAVLMALGWAAVRHRAAVMHAWPPAERAYRLIGLE